jgi:hypothetical protein
MVEVFSCLEKEENRSQLEILEDILTTSADLVRPRLPGANQAGEISLEQGRIIYEQARNLMLAAACAALEKRPLYSKRKPEVAMRFLDHAKFGMPRRGSYIVTIVSPVSPRLALSQDPLGDDFAGEPFERKVVRTLAEAIFALERAARSVAATSDPTPMREAVGRGVSANLCEAIIGLHEGCGEKGVEFAFSWAPLRPVPDKVPKFAAINADAISILRETVRYFRASEGVESSEVLGVVNKLQHQGDSGRITILGTADGVPRTITMDLVGSDHALAVISYQNRIPLSCVGELTREGRSWFLKNPREISLLEGDDNSAE